MSIPGVNIKAVRGIRPMQVERIGGAIKNINPTGFHPSSTVYAIDGDEDMFFQSPRMDGVSWKLSGITRDSTGAVLANCVVDLFYTSNDVLAGETVSDATTGAFSLLVSPNAAPYFAVAYKPGSPDVAGTTVNTLTPSAT